MQFFTPPQHINFKAAKLFDGQDNVKDISLAYIEQGGGGPIQPHTHQHDHLFTVIKGEAKIVLGDKFKIIKKNESFLVKGNISHSVWNNTEEQCVMLGTSMISHSVEIDIAK